MEDKKDVDWELCLSLTNGKADLAKELLSMFSQGIPQSKQDITTAFEQGDMHMLAQHAHKFHGACCYCGVPHLKEVVHALEIAAKAENNSECGQLIEQMHSAIDAVEASIAAGDYLPA